MKPRKRVGHLQSCRNPAGLIGSILASAPLSPGLLQIRRIYLCMGTSLAHDLRFVTSALTPWLPASPTSSPLRSPIGRFNTGLARLSSPRELTNSPFGMVSPLARTGILLCLVTVRWVWCLLVHRCNHGAINWEPGYSALHYLVGYNTAVNIFHISGLYLYSQATICCLDHSSPVS